MQHTTKYQFNLIDRNDPFSPDKLNENTQKMEYALVAQESTTTAALGSHTGDLAQHAYVKLGSLEVPANTTETFTISDPENYRMLVSSILIKGATDTVFRVRVNSTDTGIITPDKYSTAGSHIIHVLMTLGGQSCGFRIMASGLAGSSTPQTFGCPVLWNAIRTLDYVGNAVDASVTVYGLKA